MKSRHCELCGADAAVFCPSDAAFLCRSCDSKVHQANFLVARHLRHPVCSNCNDLTGDVVSGVAFHISRSLCPSCSPASDDDDSVSSGYSYCSSDCISSTTSPPEKGYSGGCRDSNRDSDCSRQRGGDSRRVDYLNVFVDWSGKLGVGDDVAVRMAFKGLTACSESLTVLPFRVCLAASMWLGLRLSGEESAATWQVLKRLEEISCVPAKIISAAELKLERDLRRLQRRRLELEEGWAEC